MIHQIKIIITMKMDIPTGGKNDHLNLYAVILAIVDLWRNQSRLNHRGTVRFNLASMGEISHLNIIATKNPTTKSGLKTCRIVGQIVLYKPWLQIAPLYKQSKCIKELIYPEKVICRGARENVNDSPARHFLGIIQL